MERKAKLNAVGNPQRSLLKQLRERLILCISLLVFCLLLSIVVGIYVSYNQQQLGEQKVALHDNVNGLLQAMINQETGLRGYITTNNMTFLDPATSGQTQYDASLQKLQAETASTDFSATSAALAQAENRANAWITNYKNVQLASMQAGNLQSARAETINTQGKNLFDTFRVAVTYLQQRSDSDLAQLQDRDNKIDYGVIGGISLLTILAIIWLWRTFSLFTRIQREQLETLKEASVAFAEGNLTIRVQEGADIEFNDVGHTFNIMAATLQEQQRALRDRDILEYVSQLNTILTESLDLDSLMQTFLHRLLTLLDIQVATLYLYTPEEQKLTLFSSQGLQADAIQSSFALNEGLVGRVAHEREALMIGRREQTGNAFQVRTIMGAVLPASLYHLPLTQGKELVGVLAVGSIQPMSEQTRNVLNVVSANLAAAIHNAQAYKYIQQQAQELAERTQQQAQANLALRRQRDELTVLNAALEEANRVRSQFLSTMSHELRTPLTSIIGFSQIIQRSAVKAPLSKQQTNNVERILKNAHHLLSLINDVLDLAKIEAGRMDINASQVDLKELLTAVVDETRALALERGLRLTCEVEDGITSIETDARKVRQILLNLISNSLKFTEQGSVSVQAMWRNKATDDESEQIVIAVKDSGIGIAPEKQAHIFDAFYQVDNSNSRNYGGTGLGLSIVHELTTLLGGKVEFQSQPGAGSTFSIVLPVHIRDQRFIQDLRLNTLSEQGSGVFSRDINDARILLEKLADEQERQDAEKDEYLIVAIDDNQDVLQLIASSLEQTPYRVVGVQDSTQAIAVIQELKPKAITLDIMMPKVNGWQILHQLKSNPATASIPVILLTVLEDRSAGYVLGADEYLVKPVAREALLHVLHQLTSRPEVAIVTDDTQAEKQIAQQATTGMRTEKLKPILLVHNERDIHTLMERLVREIGYSIQTTSNGQDVMAIIEKAHPDLLMMMVTIDDSKITSDLGKIIIESQPSSQLAEPVNETAQKDP